MEFRMITYPLCCLTLGRLSSAIFLLLLLPNKYFLVANCVLNTRTGEREDCKKHKSRGLIQSPKVQMTKQRKNSAVINKLKAPNLEKQILHCLANICWVAEWRSIVCQPLCWENTTGSTKINETQPFPPHIDDSKRHVPSTPWRIRATSPVTFIVSLLSNLSSGALLVQLGQDSLWVQ